MHRQQQSLYRRAVGNPAYPVDLLWAADDPALRLASYGEKARAAAGVSSIHIVAAKHLLQEDQAPAIAECVANLAARASANAPAWATRDG
jgi:pimeloyl-ACP methyl ester carboxylesterase